TRFPLIHAFYPASPRLVAALGYGAFLDQGWGLATDRQEPIGGEMVTAHDVVESTGGIAQVKLGTAYRLFQGLWIGAGGGMYTGSVQRTLTRSLPDSTTAGLRGFRSRTEWSYNAPLATAGLRADLGSFARVGAGVTWAGTLDASGRDSTALDRSFALPLQA